MIAYGGLLSFIALYGREIGIQNASLYFLIFSFGIAAARLTAGRSLTEEVRAGLLQYVWFSLF